MHDRVYFFHIHMRNLEPMTCGADTAKTEAKWWDMNAVFVYSSNANRFHSQQFSQEFPRLHRNRERRRCIEMERVANLPIAFGVLHQPARRKTLDCLDRECRAGCVDAARTLIFSSVHHQWNVDFRCWLFYCHCDAAVLIASAIPITRNIDRCASGKWTENATCILCASFTPAMVVVFAPFSKWQFLGRERVQHSSAFVCGWIEWL